MMNNKKNAEVIGRLRYPLVLDMPAYIQEADGILRTSRVMRVEESTPAMVRFETVNTNYCLRFDGGVQYERV